MEQQKPCYTDIQKYHKTILDSLNILKEELISLPELVNTGNSFVIIGVENETILSKIIPDSKLINEVSEELDLIGYYIYALSKGNQERDAKTRMFAPRYGIKEEAATGMAAGPLACFLYDKKQIKKKEFNIEQGYLMEKPSPSIINVKLEIDNQNIVSLMAGGRGKIMKEKMISI